MACSSILILTTTIAFVKNTVPWLPAARAAQQLPAPRRRSPAPVRALCACAAPAGSEPPPRRLAKMAASTGRLAVRRLFLPWCTRFVRPSGSGNRVGGGAGIERGVLGGIGASTALCAARAAAVRAGGCRPRVAVHDGSCSLSVGAEALEWRECQRPAACLEGRGVSGGVGRGCVLSVRPRRLLRPTEQTKPNQSWASSLC